MKKKIHPYSKKVTKDNHLFHLDKNVLWIIEITFIAFIMTIVLSLFSDIVISNVNIFVSIIILLVFVFLGILFDMIGVAVTVADKKTFHSMAAKRVRGAKTAIKFINNNSKVSSFCNDVIGDICGIISGGAGVTIALSLSDMYSINLVLVNLLMTSLVAALTIGGKACGKAKAINKSNAILYRFAKIIEIVTFKK